MHARRARRFSSRRRAIAACSVRMEPCRAPRSKVPESREEPVAIPRERGGPVVAIVEHAACRPPVSARWDSHQRLFEAWIPAIVPSETAIVICRMLFWITSPAANTPGIDVCIFSSTFT